MKAAGSGCRKKSSVGQRGLDALFGFAIASVKPGETVAIHTLDAFENKMTPKVKKFSDVCQIPFVNPQTGPVIVEGAEPGDTLSVKIHSIEPDRWLAMHLEANKLLRPELRKEAVSLQRKMGALMRLLGSD